MYVKGIVFNTTPVLTYTYVKTIHITCKKFQMLRFLTFNLRALFISFRKIFGPLAESYRGISTPTKDELYCENDSLTPPSRFYIYTEEKITQIVSRRYVSRVSTRVRFLKETKSFGVTLKFYTDL